VHPAAIEFGYQSMHLTDLDLSVRLQRFANPPRKALGLADLMLTHLSHAHAKADRLRSKPSRVRQTSPTLALVKSCLRSAARVAPVIEPLGLASPEK
jgi:hypothetical protein